VSIPNPDDVGFLAVSRRLKLMSSGEKDESNDPKPEDLKRGKSVISDILNANQNYSSWSQSRCGLRPS
jgi:hypothetical protein